MIYRFVIGGRTHQASIDMCFNIQAETEEQAVRKANAFLNDGHFSINANGAEHIDIYTVAGVTAENIMEELEE